MLVLEWAPALGGMLFDILLTTWRVGCGDLRGSDEKFLNYPVEEASWNAVKHKNRDTSLICGDNSHPPLGWFSRC